MVVVVVVVVDSIYITYTHAHIENSLEKMASINHINHTSALQVSVGPFLTCG